MSQPLSAEARNLNWLVSSFVERVPGVREATVVSSDGLLIAISDGLDRTSGDRLAAVAAGMLSIAKGGAVPIGGGRVHEVIVEMDHAMLFVMRVSDTSVLAVTTARPCDVGLVGYEMAVLVDKCASALTPALVSELQTLAEVGDPMSAAFPPPAHCRPSVRAHAWPDVVVARHARTARADPRARSPPTAARGTATPEDRRIVELTQTPVSLAEIAARIGAPVGVVRVLVGDLADAGYVQVRVVRERRRAPRRRAARTAAGGYPCALTACGRPPPPAGRTPGRVPPGAHGTTSAAAPSSSEPVLPVSMKIVVAGGYAVGKTTLVGTISEIEPLTTEADITVESLGVDFAGPVQGQKTGTTVAMDFGRITLGPDMVLYLFGTPGQDRFLFLWDELVRGAVGGVVLVDTRRIEDCFPAVDYFEHLGIPFVVAVNLFNGVYRHHPREVREALSVPANVPVVLCDARNRLHVKETLVLLVEGALRRAQGASAGKRSTGASEELLRHAAVT